MITFEEMKRLAESGDRVAQRHLGAYYSQGGWWGVHHAGKDIVKSAEWYRKSAKQGYADAQVRLGDAYLRGRGVSQNSDQALYWYHKAAEQKWLKAQNELGRIYGHGLGVKQDNRLAYVWHTIASNNKGRKAKDYKRELKETLSTEEMREAQCILGEMYADGEYVDQSDSTAISWWKKSAENGLPLAQRYLVDAYLAEENYYEACIWFYAACRLQDVGNARVVSQKKGEQLEKMLEQHLSQNEISEAKAIATEYITQEGVKSLTRK